jgi:hypothetical protein
MADLELRQEGEVVWATMNRPDRLNALSRNLVTELREFFVGLYWRRDVRVVVLRGAGNAFCAGLDLKERGDPQGSRSIGAGLTRQREISEIVIAMRRCPQPIVACVNGAAAGGGFALALEWFNGEAFGWGDLSVVPYLNGSVGHGHPPPDGSKLAAWLARANARPSVAACVADIAALNAAGASMTDVAELVERGLFKREYRDHRLEWMIKSGGVEVVLKGLDRGNIRFAPPFG